MAAFERGVEPTLVHLPFHLELFRTIERYETPHSRNADFRRLDTPRLASAHCLARSTSGGMGPQSAAFLPL